MMDQGKGWRTLFSKEGAWQGNIHCPMPPIFGMPHLGPMMTRDGACGEVPFNPYISWDQPLPSTPTTYTHLGQTLTPVCYRGHLPCSLLPFWSVTRLSSLFIIKIELENGEKSSSTSSFTICCSYNEKSSFASFESGVGRVLGGAGPPQCGIEHEK